MPDATGFSGLDVFLVWAGAAVVVFTLGGFLWRFVRSVILVMRRVNEFFDDWYGEPPRVGLPSRPGALERIAGLEERLAGVEHELRPNSGRSLRDQVDLVNCRLRRLLPDDEDHCRHGEPPDPAPPGG
ncbi:hypothetical protein [Streptomyces sp. NPDC047070]|uniref:hypothetical protein n=1 Tax=Streptomyces sp. NPDC047070 TaxID=3154923 RepID=UPI00345423A7